MIYQLLSFFASAGDPCQPRSGSFFGFPTWYKYLTGIQQTDGGCDVNLTGLSDIWKIAAAALEILLRLGGLIAVGFIIFGGFKLLTSQGDPEGVKSGKNTITNAVVGLAIA